MKERIDIMRKSIKKFIVTTLAVTLLIPSISVKCLYNSKHEKKNK